MSKQCETCIHNGEKSVTGNCIKCRDYDRYESEDDREAREEARREAMMLDDNEDSLKWRFTH